MVLADGEVKEQEAEKKNLDEMAYQCKVKWMDD